MSKNIQAIYPLSPLQEGILFHTIETPHSDIYFQQYACVLDNLDDAAKWQQSWQVLSSKHAIMRTLFTWENRAQPLQIVREHVQVPWTHLDWQAVSQEQATRDWQHLMQRDRDLNFDLSGAPLMRFTLAKLDTNRYYFLFSFHHIVLDGWSQRLLFDAAMDIYVHQQISGIGSQAQPETTSYSDFIDYLGTLDKEAAYVFWQSQLKGFQSPTNIGNDVDSPNGRVTNQTLIEKRGMLEHKLNSQTFEALQAQAKRYKLTINTLIMGAWALVLASHNRVNDVVFGTTVAGRPVELPHSDTIAGLFINTLPCRAQLNTDIPSHQWLSQIQSQQAACRAYEQTPLADIQRLSEVNAGQSLFDTIVVVENLPSTSLVSEQYKDSSLPEVSNSQYVEYSHYPLALLVDLSDGLTLIAVHQHSKISEKRARGILNQVESVLEHFSQSLEPSLDNINILSNPQQLALEQQWCKNQVSFENLKPVHHLFEEQAERQPEAIAIIDASNEAVRQLTYQQINEQANQLADFLMNKCFSNHTSQQTDPQNDQLVNHQMVAILLDKSADALISFLAVMKAGAAYVVLDTDLPSSRLDTLLKSLQNDKLVLISHSKLCEKVSPSAFHSMVLVDEDKQAISQHTTKNHHNPVHLTQLAYLIFTSGSTGTPKGVMISHGALANSTLARKHYYQKPPCRFLLVSALSTDSSIAGTYWPITTGTTLILPKKRIEQDMHALGELCKDHKVSHVLCIPSLYSLMLENIEQDALQCLNTVVVAGEQCQLSIVKQHQQRLSHANLYNEYGPSEACVWASVACLYESSAMTDIDSVTIGKAIANTQLYVLDQYANPVLPNVVGELYISGANLANGYLHQDNTSNSAFIDNPFYMPELQNPVMYKTGDLVKADEDGEFTFIGRADNQLKIRGFRIEPEEIEKTLASHPIIDEVLVVAESSNQADVSVSAILNALHALPDAESEVLLLSIEQNHNSIDQADTQALDDTTRNANK